MKILYPGEYSARLKSFPLLTDIMIPLLKKTKGLELVFACRIFSSKELKIEKKIINLASQNGIGKKCVFLNYVKDISKLIKNSDLIIFPAEQMRGKFDIPLVLIESLMLGKIVLVSDINPLEEIYKYDKGLSKELVIPNKIELWQDKIKKALKMDRKSDMIKYFQKNFSFDAKKIKNLINFINE